MLVVAPGTPRRGDLARLGYEWTGTLGFETGEKLILLDGDGKVARFFDYRGDGRFAGLETPIARARRAIDAVFRVRRPRDHTEGVMTWGASTNSTCRRPPQEGGARSA